MFIEFPYDYRTEVEEHEHFNFFSGQEAILDIEKSLVGLHQIENAGMAIELSLVYASKVGIELTEDVIRSGIREAFGQLVWKNWVKNHSFYWMVLIMFMR